MNALITRNLGKKYEIYRRPMNRLLEWATLGKRRLHEDFWALRGINLEVAKGQTLGIIGLNGAGKSTLLKLLCGVSSPSEGSIEVSGRVTGLLELGAGFHPEFTGRENAIMSCSLLGMSRSEIRKKIDEVAEFAAIGEFFDQPVRTYSSGMYMRLGFAAASSLDPSLLVVDEALAVGDEYFMQKCVKRFDDFRQQGKTIILVTHLMRNVRRLCDRAVLLEQGRLVADGNPDEVADLYLESLARHATIRQPSMGANAQSVEGEARAGGEIRFFDPKILDKDGRERDLFSPGQPVEFKVAYAVDKPIKKGLFGILIYREDGTLLIQHCPDLEQGVEQHWDKLKDLVRLAKQKSPGDCGEVSCRINSLPLLGGTYFITFWICEVSQPLMPVLGYSQKKYFTVMKDRWSLEGQYYCQADWKETPIGPA